MVKGFSLADIIKSAMGNEDRGHRFYAALAGQARDPATRDIFHKLAVEEIEHKRAFEKLMDMELEKHPPEDLNENTKKYLQAVIVTNVFPKIDSGEEYSVNTPEQALGIGIQAEKDSILLYQEIYNNVQSPTVKELLSKILEEEKMHLVELREQMEEFSPE